MHTNKTPGSISSPWGIVLTASLLGAAGVHTYLLNEHLKIKYTSDPASTLCNISDTFNCSASITSSFSEFFGTPLALFGIITQLVMLYFVLKATVLRKTEPASPVAFSIGVFTVAISVLMAGLSIFIIKSLCPFCTAAYVLSLISLVAAWKLLKPAPSQWDASVLKTLLASAVVIAGVGLVTGQIIKSRYQDKDTQEMMALVISDWKSQPQKEINVIAPIKSGPDSAKMKIIEFADFLCIHCKHAFPKLKNFVHVNKDAQLLFQAFPLDGCSGPNDNPGRQCQMAVASYCGNLQDKGEAAAEYMFNSQELFAQTTDVFKEFKLMASFININSETFLACIKDVNSLEMIKKQMELGKKLEIKGTPALFINNKFFQGPPDLVPLQEAYRNL